MPATKYPPAPLTEGAREDCPDFTLRKDADSGERRLLPKFKNRQVYSTAPEVGAAAPPGECSHRVRTTVFPLARLNDFTNHSSQVIQIEYPKESCLSGGE